MITKINKIKNLGIFDNYTPKANLRDFKKYNLIYGWNGSGKTTLSRVFDSLGTGLHPEFPTLEYEVENESGTKYKQTEIIGQKIRVFNQDYIENNLKIRDGRAKSITLILGDASKEVVEQIEKDELELKRKNELVKKEEEKSEQKEKTKGKTFTEIAKTIYVAITGGATRTYRKDNAEHDFALLSVKQLLSQDDLDNLSIVVKQTPKSAIVDIESLEADFGHSQKKTKIEIAIGDLLTSSKTLMSQKVDALVIDRFKENADISNWVETGLKIHEDHKSKNCEFCAQKLPVDRLEILAKHFNTADRDLKNSIEGIIGKFDIIKTTLSRVQNLPDSARFYDEFIIDYQKSCLEFVTEVTGISESITKIQDILRGKKSKTTESVDFAVVIDTTKLLTSRNKISNFIAIHNKKTSDFENAKNDAISKLKNHYLSTIFDEIKKLQEEIFNHKTSISNLYNGDLKDPTNIGILALKERITENQAKVSSTHKACSDINKGLATFLGRAELVFEPHKVKILDENGVQKEIDDGYIIKRNNKAVTHLSEGEKTAIAFVYFTIHLNDSSFDKKNGIVVVDDPISSLDSNSLFQAFSFLKNSVKDAGQIFIMTHNFDFLRLILNWLQDRHVKDSEKSFYMIKNQDTPSGRTAFLDELDNDLRKYETEYNYLFNILNTFQSDGTIASVYHMPNIARKVLESFLMFRVPNSQNMYEKIESLKTLFDENKITAIYKFTNDQSHIAGKGFDPCLVPETQKVVKYMLEFIEATFPEHYKVLTTR